MPPPTSLFQSTRPHGARHALLTAQAESDSFNPRARTGRDFQRSWHCRTQQPFQSTRPHGARPASCIQCSLCVEVSIHAPARGATQSAHAHHRPRHCFNPRARTGRDFPVANCAGVVVSFNPRARTGRDLKRHKGAYSSAFQSTRPHGARRPRLRPILQRAQRFNPRARTGRDAPRARNCPMHQKRFQSTRPHGARPCVRLPSGILLTFQSTRPHGARHGFAHVAHVGAGVSIHAPARGATAEPRQRDDHSCRRIPPAHPGR